MPALLPLLGTWFKCQPLTEASDVYSLGMVFFTLISGKVPYDDDQERLETAFYSGTRPDIDPSWHRGFVKVGFSINE